MDSCLDGRTRPVTEPAAFRDAGMVDITNAPRSILSTATGESFFAIGVSEGATAVQTSAQVAITSHQREINRIRGYKLQLTPADNQRLAKLQEKIVTLNQKAADGTIRADEIRQRGEYYRQADRILGKPSIDVDADVTLSALSRKIDDLLAPKLDPARQKRLNLLEKLKGRLESRLEDKPSNKTVIGQLRNIIKQIEQVAPARGVNTLSAAEKRTYDDLVRQVNDYAKAKLMLNAKESTRVYELQKSIDQLSELLPPDTANQPTAAQAASLYARLR
jgi:hypothetical protein